MTAPDTGLTDPALIQAANTILSLLNYAQLHSSAAGTAGSANVISTARIRVPWGLPSGSGNFSLVAAMLFTGLPANSPVYSVTLWDSLTGGGFWSEYPITVGDATANAAGQYQVTAIDITGSAS